MSVVLIRPRAGHQCCLLKSCRARWTSLLEQLRQRDIAHAVGITVGAVQKIINELKDGGYLTNERIGRRNRYHVTADHPLRHPLESSHTVRDLLTALGD